MIGTPTRRYRRRSPIQAIVDFFLDASPTEGQQALEIAQAIVEKRAAPKPARRAPISTAARVLGVHTPTDPPAAAPAAPAASTALPTATPTKVPKKKRKGTAGGHTPRRRRPAAAASTGQPAAGAGSQPRRRRPAVTGPAAEATPAALPPLPDQQPPGDDNPEGVPYEELLLRREDKQS